MNVILCVFLLYTLPTEARSFVVKSFARHKMLMNTSSHKAWTAAHNIDMHWKSSA